MKRFLNLDNWKNILNFKNDKRLIGADFSFNILPAEQKEKLYSYDLLIKKIIDIIPKIALKKPISLINTEGQDVHNFLDKIEFHNILLQCFITSRIYGGAIWIPNIIDNGILETPLDYSKVRNIEKGVILNNSECYLKDGDEEYVYFRNKTLEKIHISRCFIFYGEYIPKLISYTFYNGFGGSIIDVIYKDVYNYHLAHDVPTLLLVDYSKPIFKLESLNEKLSMGEFEQISEKIKTIDSVSNITKSVILDKNDEYERVEISATNIDKLIYQTERKLCALTNIPHTLLLGEAPEGGLSNSTKQQQLDFYDFVYSERQRVLAKNIRKFLEILKTLFKNNTLDFVFPNLFELDELEKAEVNKKKAEAAKIRIENILKSVELEIISIDEARNLLLKENNLIDNDAREILNFGSWL